MKFHTNYNEEPLIQKVPHIYSEPDPVSQTIPDASMPIREIVRRFAAGLPVQGQRVGFFDELEPVPDLQRMDLAEREEAILQVEEELKEIETRQQQRNREKQEREARKKFEAEQKKLSDEKSSDDLKSTNTP